MSKLPLVLLMQRRVATHLPVIVFTRLPHLLCLTICLIHTYLPNDELCRRTTSSSMMTNYAACSSHLPSEW